MTFIWLAVWLLNHTPEVQFLGESGALDTNNWALALILCVFFDIGWGAS